MSVLTAGARTDGHPEVGAPEDRTRGVRITVDAVSRRARRGGTTLLDAVSLVIAPGELVAIVGPSGAGKTTLLEVMAGVAAPSAGVVRFDGTAIGGRRVSTRGILGYVPQDDIVHTELPLARTLRYAARLRLPSSTDSSAIERAVATALAAVGLETRAGTRVGALSGGERKRASIAVELLTDPRVFFLDEPTSGLDPSTRADFIGQLRDLADRTATVVFTTHAVEDLDGCDRVVFLARGGRVAFVGPVDAALAHFGADSVPELYRLLSDGVACEPYLEVGAPSPSVTAAGVRALQAQPVAGPFTQWRVLTSRTIDTIAGNRLTLAILLGSPALVVAMFAVLFRPGAFDRSSPSPSSMVMVGFWVVFAAFFFGLTYGLLQICTERAILERERFVGLRPGAYLASKLTVLVPFLAGVVVAMLAVLRALDRLPARPIPVYLSIGVGLLLCAIAALGLGLLTSALVGNPAQATLALPMLCFPAVLFSGAVLPVHLMAGAGSVISVAVPTRWAFEVMGHDIGARHVFARGASPLGPPLLASYGDAGTLATTTSWAALACFAVAFLAATWAVLARTTRGATR